MHRTLIYDADCRLCTNAKESLEKLGADARFVPYQGDEAKRLLAARHHPGRPAVAYLIERDGTVREGLDAFIPLLPVVPGGRVLSLLWRVPPLRPLARLGYRLVARYRYPWFGERRLTCDTHSCSG